MVFIIFMLLTVLGFAAFAIVIRLSDRHGGDDNDGDDQWWRRGHDPRPHGPKPGGPEPAWWPEFEREFRAYVSAQAGRRTISGVGS